MAININDFRSLLNYNEYLNEMAISDEELQKHNTFIRNINDIKNNANILKDNIFKLNEILTNNDFVLSKEDENDNKIYYTIIYPPDAYHIFIYFRDILVRSEIIDSSLHSKYFNIIYPDGEKINLDTEIEIEKNNLNRIHVPLGLPKICRGVGLGKKIYKLLIKELNYISTNKLDRNLDSIFVWDSLRKDKNIYSFIKKEQMLCIDSNYDFDKILNILLDYFKNEIEDSKKNITNNYYIIDSDFREKYFNEILKTDLKMII